MDLLRLSQRIRQLRLSQGLTLTQLAEKSGFSKGFVSQVENFRLTPSLKALQSLAAALGVNLRSIFDDAGAAPQFTFGSFSTATEVRRNSSEEFGMRYFALAYEQIGRKLDPFMIEYRTGGAPRPALTHDTEEFFLLLEGSVEIQIADHPPKILNRGDSVYMRANLPHVVKLVAPCEYARALVIYAPDNQPQEENL